MAKLVTVRFEYDEEADFFIECVKLRGDYVRCAFVKVTQGNTGYSISTSKAREIVKCVLIKGESQNKVAKKFNVGSGTVNRLVKGLSRRDDVGDIIEKYEHRTLVNNGRKLTDDQVREIRSYRVTMEQASKKFGISIATIRKIRNGTRYKHVK